MGNAFNKHNLTNNRKNKYILEDILILTNSV
jgi:hypothetical protein